MTDPNGAVDAMEMGGGRRLAAAPDALSVETRSGGGWIRTRVLPYEDIRAVYRYEQLNTRTLIAVLAGWLVLLVGLLTIGAAAQWPGTTLGLGAMAVTLIAAALGVVRARSAPARMLRIEAYSGVMIVPDRSSVFFQSLAARIRVSNAGSAPVPGAQPAYAETPALPFVEGVENRPTA